MHLARIQIAHQPHALQQRQRRQRAQPARENIWYVAPLHLPRGMDAAALQAKLEAHGIANIRMFGDIASAYHVAFADSTENDRIVAFGSFHTVAEVMEHQDKPTGHHAAG